MILEQIDDNYMWALVFILIVNLSQRKIPHSDRKRFATIWICAIMMLFEIGTVTIIVRKWNHYWAWAVLGICVALAVIFRSRVWPFRLHCRKCHKKLDWNHIIGHDDNLCPDCYDLEHPDEAKERKEKEKAKEIEEHPDRKPLVVPYTVAEMDWDVWNPSDRCVITYLFDGDNVLLIDKKRGLGTGLVNAPGGHIEAAETADEAAKREFKEETGLEIEELSRRGELSFQFKDGLGEHAYVYFAKGYSGTLAECDETRPFWQKKTDLPYDRMWEDDQLWLPIAMSGKLFKGYFIFDGQKMLDHKIESWDEHAD